MAQTTYRSRKNGDVDAANLTVSGTASVTGAATLTGALTQAAPPIFAVGTVAATGSTQGDVAAISSHVTYVTAGDGTKGVKLPTAVAGTEYRIYGTVATVVPVFPNTSDTINNGSANASVSISGRTLAIFTAVTATNWAGNYS